MIQPVISKSGYTYIYSSYINSILLSPSENEYVDIDMDKNAYEYYKQKYPMFLCNMTGRKGANIRCYYYSKVGV